MRQDESLAGVRHVSNRGVDNRDLEDRGIRPDRAQVRVAQAPPPARSAPFPVVAATNRTIFVVDADPFKSLAKDFRDSAIAELTRLFQFVGSTRGQKVMSISLLAPDRFPEVFAFSDAVVATVTSTALLESHVRDAVNLQVGNATFSLGQQGVQFANPFANTPRRSLNPDRKGLSRSGRFVQSRRAFPFMDAAVSLDEIMVDFVEEADSKVQVERVRIRRAQLSPKENPRYWGTWVSLFETAIMSVLDNPTDPTQWLWDRPLFGQLIGRAMAHEVRHLYVGSGHAAAGLGSDSANLVKATDFSTVDKRAILRSIQALEGQQGRNPIVPTFPQGHRTDFPF